MKYLRLIALSLLLSAMTACASPTSASLDGTSWLVTEIKGEPTLSTHQPTMAFSSGKVNGVAGCNHYSGGYAQNGTGLSVTDLATTMMGCSPEAVAAQESAFVAAVGQVTRLVETTSGVELQNSAGQALLALTKAAADPSQLPLQGTTWSLTTIRVGQTASSLVADSSVTLRIDDKSYAGTACNNFGGNLTVDGSKATFATPHSTKMACKGELMQQESTVLGLLTKTTSFKITGTQLSLSAADGSGLDFTGK